MRIGVCGYSAQRFDEESAHKILVETLEQYKDKDPIIVSGLTNLGVPAIAYWLANAEGYKTIGIACKKAVKYDCFPCDQVHLIGEEWGDESETFLAAIDVLIRVGGGNQSKKECAKAKELGILTIEYELEALKD